MIPVLVLSHGDLANAILESARKIDPHLVDDTDAVTLPWEVDTDTATNDLRNRLKEMDRGDGVLILTDMFGGTATNLALPFLDRCEFVQPRHRKVAVATFTTFLVIWFLLTLVGFMFRGPNWSWVWPWQEWHGEL